MLYAAADYYEVLDATRQTSLTVVAEADTREESEEYLRSKRLYESCFISKDADQELFRVICQVVEAGDRYDTRAAAPGM